MTHTQPEAIALADQVVVMDHGSIEQAASPRDIYNRPYSPYVARFMGGQNVLSGKVTGIGDDGMATVEGKGGYVYRVKPVDRVETGQELRFSVRRDRIRLGHAAGERNCLSGIVTNTEYQGTFVKVAIDSGEREEFIIYLDEDAYFAQPIDVGETVHAEWDASLNHHLIGLNNSTGTPHED